MAYAIERDETLHASILRIMDEQLVRAREALAEKDVHEARKRFKEIRAVLRLVREPLGAPFAQENAWFRDAARDLAAARDADAVREALDKLQLPKATHRRARKTLDAQRTAHAPLEPIVADVVDRLVVAQGRLAMWPQLDDSFDTIAPGLLRTYREGRRGMKSHRDAESLHEWRKRVKELWYHAQLLRPVWPEMMKPYAAVLSTLSKTLGDHHDLHVLRGLLPELAAVIDERQHALEVEAMDVGRRVYAEKPAAWLARMRNTWKAWSRTAPSPKKTSAAA